MLVMMECVRAFHEKLDVSKEEPWRKPGDSLLSAGKELLEIAKGLEQWVALGDRQALRAHLLIEELGEFLVSQTEHEALDGLTDLLYVLTGTAIMYDWPMCEAFSEVHASNMTKVKQSDDELNERIREKGKDFKSPDLKQVLNTHRAGGYSKHGSAYIKQFLESIQKASTDGKK